MRTKITGKQMELTDAMRSYIEKKIAKINKFQSRVSEIEVVISSEGISSRVELIIRTGNTSPFVVTCSNEDAYVCVDAAVDKIERQIVRFKEKHNRKGRTSAAEAGAEAISARSEIEKK